MMSIRQQIQRAQETRAVTHAERQKLESHVSLLRASGLDQTASIRVAASRRAADSACSRPAADSGTSRQPWKRRSRFQSVSA